MNSREERIAAAINLSVTGDYAFVVAVQSADGEYWPRVSLKTEDDWRAFVDRWQDDYTLNIVYQSQVKNILFNCCNIK